MIRIDDVGIGLTPDEHQHRGLAVGIAALRRSSTESPRGPRRKCAPPTHCDRPQSAAGSRWRGRVDHRAHFPVRAPSEKLPLGTLALALDKTNGHLPVQCRICSEPSDRVRRALRATNFPPPRLAPLRSLAKAFAPDRFGGIVHLALGQQRGSQREHEDGSVRRIGFPVRGIGRKIGGQVAAGCVMGSTSREAALMSRSKSNCRVTAWSRGARRGHFADGSNARELPLHGLATKEAMISGLAPGKDADTLTVGKSTCGKETGSNRKATAPASAIAIVRRVVAIGLRMKGSEMLMPVLFPQSPQE